MRTTNRVTLFGTVGNKNTVSLGNGKQVVKMSIATQESWKEGDEWKNKTVWHNVSAFDIFQRAMENTEVGDYVFVEGKLSYSEWEKDGIKRNKTEIVLTNFVNVGRKKKIETNNTEEDDLPF